MLYEKGNFLMTNKNLIQEKIKAIQYENKTETLDDSSEKHYKNDNGRESYEV